MKISQERLNEILDYDFETGIFVWKIGRRKCKKDSIAGSLTGEGYWQIKIDNKLYLSHRLVFLYVDGYLPENQIDHIDRDKLNNRYNNLREVSQSCNMRNCNVYKTNKSGITGVHWHKRDKKWVAYIAIPKIIHLGYFDNILDAAKARWEAEIEHNFPNCNTTSSAYMYLKKNERIHKINE